LTPEAKPKRSCGGRRDTAVRQPCRISCVPAASNCTNTALRLSCDSMWAPKRRAHSTNSSIASPAGAAATAQPMM